MIEDVGLKGEMLDAAFFWGSGVSAIIMNHFFFLDRVRKHVKNIVKYYFVVVKVKYYAQKVSSVVNLTKMTKAPTK